MITKLPRVFVTAVLAVGLLVVAGCQQKIPKEALQLTQESLAQRQAQTRRFDTTDEAMLLSASAAVLQDLGFNLDESETKLGLVVASKNRDATEAGQVIGAILIAALIGARVPIDKTQKLRASLVTKPFGETGDQMSVRVTFQRTVWNNQGRVSKTEALTEPELYQEFFSKLSKSVFLEAQKI